MSEENKSLSAEQSPSDQVSRADLNVKPLTDLNDSNDSNDLNVSNDTMEVHKHPHHVTHKKKWGEYFLEFLMLFLAVFLGFITENIREGISENSKAKELAEQ